MQFAFLNTPRAFISRDAKSNFNHCRQCLLDHDVFELEISKLMHNIENNEHLPDYISKNFERVNWKHNYNTRHSCKSNYVLPKIRMETGKK